MKKEGKRPILAIILSITFFILGNICAYLLLSKGDFLPTRAGFKNPTGVPHIKGPTGPPPQPSSEANLLPEEDITPKQ